MNTELDRIETMLAHFICADALDDENEIEVTKDYVQYDAGSRLGFDTMLPSKAHIAGSEDRLFTPSHEWLLHRPQELIGKESEVALLGPGFVKWYGFRKIRKAPKSVFVTKKGVDLYEIHYRLIQSDGNNVYFKRVGAVDKNGAAVKVVNIGANGGGFNDSVGLIIAASMIEDCYRAGAFQASVQQDAGVIFPVEQGHHLEVFKLRDGPYTGSRRKPLLHWVAKHLRKSSKPDPVEVKEHLRGVHQFDIDGLHVELSADQAHFLKEAA